MLYRAIPKRGPGGGGGSSVVRGKTTSWIVVGTTAFLVLCLLLSIDSRLAARLDRDKAAAAAAGKAHVNTSSKPATSSLFALPSISEAKPPQPSPSSKSADAGLAKAASAAKDSKQTSSPLLSSSVYKLLPQSKDQSTWDIYEQTLADFITSSLPEHGGLRRRALAALQREGHRKRSGQRTGDELEGKAIPEIIWQTRPRRQVAPGAGSDNAYDDNDFRGDSFSLLNPTWKRFVLDDDQLEAWVKSQLGEKTSSLYETWHSIRDNGIAKADVFRYLAMALEGGIYSGEFSCRFCNAERSSLSEMQKLTFRISFDISRYRHCLSPTDPRMGHQEFVSRRPIPAHFCLHYQYAQAPDRYRV